MKVVNVGARHFAEALEAQGQAVLQLDWRPPAGGDARLTAALERLDTPAVADANREARAIITRGHPVLVDVGRAADLIPGMQRTTILHSGPPNRWETMAGPQRGAVMGALMLEGLAATPEAAEELAASGEIEFRANNDCGCVGPMAGVISYSSALFVVENREFGNRAYTNLNEGYGKVLRMGAYAPDVLDRLRWLNTTVAVALRHALSRLDGGLDLRSLIAQALHMGDECHNRNKAAGALFLRELAPGLATAGLEPDELARVVDFLGHNEVWFVNLSMAACKATLDAARGIPGSTVVTCMARNGYEFGLQVAGLPGRWFTGPAQKVKALYFPGFTEEDAALDIGDSVITETAGIGGFAMAAAPAIVQFVGGTPDLAVELTEQMYEITCGESPFYTIPTFGFRGTPTGIDVRKVVETGILPSINTGVAHRLPGIGQVGAGLVHPPFSIFAEALLSIEEAVK
ncbi:MAG TPA: DUF1116 domain-containing protein [Symbiobacteriaceae bacterium]|nr:DUF1116 domain-containing protein [Symbiobacteriaceae bacterium]